MARFAHAETLSIEPRAMLPDLKRSEMMHAAEERNRDGLVGSIIVFTHSTGR
jgi:hypothetical protein